MTPLSFGGQRCPCCNSRLTPDCLGTWRGSTVCAWCADDLRQHDIDARVREQRQRDLERVTLRLTVTAHES